MRGAFSAPKDLSPVTQAQVVDKSRMPQLCAAKF
jgi:hypothetical protein